jgi:hypothetical protein
MALDDAIAYGILKAVAVILLGIGAIQLLPFALLGALYAIPWAIGLYILVDYPQWGLWVVFFSGWSMFTTIRKLRQKEILVNTSVCALVAGNIALSGLGIYRVYQYASLTPTQRLALTAVPCTDGPVAPVTMDELRSVYERVSYELPSDRTQEQLNAALATQIRRSCK